MYAWTSVPAQDWQEVEQIIQKKMNRSEIVGLVLSLADGSDGGEFLFSIDGRDIDVLLSKYVRKRQGIIDFSRYVNPILEGLEGVVAIESVLCSRDIGEPPVAWTPGL